MNLSPNGLAFLEHEEGVRLKVYTDAAEKLTIGVGHLLTPDELASGTLQINGTFVAWQNGLTQEQVDELLEQDCLSREVQLSDLVSVPLSQQQFDSLFSLMFNIGETHFAGSTLLTLLNAGDYVGASHHFQDWKYAGGKPILLPRRMRELALWNS